MNSKTTSVTAALWPLPNADNRLMPDAAATGQRLHILSEGSWVTENWQDFDAAVEGHSQQGWIGLFDHVDEDDWDSPTLGRDRYDLRSVTNVHRAFAAAGLPGLHSFLSHHGPLTNYLYLACDGETCMWSVSGMACLQEMCDLRALLALWDASRGKGDRDKARLASWIETDGHSVGWLDLPVGSYMTLPWLTDEPDIEANVESHVSVPSLPHHPDKRLRAAARALLQVNINRKLVGNVTPFFELRTGAPVTLLPNNLLGAIYLHFVNEITGQSPVAVQCPACGKFFVPEHGRQKYCSLACNQRAYRNRKKIQTTSGDTDE